MKLYAISDLHLSHPQNRLALAALPTYPDDWLIVAGDIGETETIFQEALNMLTARFAQVIWAPGNHDLWTFPTTTTELRGVAKYNQLVALCRAYGVHTPEDPYLVWHEHAAAYTLAPLFLLYDYSFRPEDVPLHQVVAWAEETGAVCVDEWLLHPDPFVSRAAWCAARCTLTEHRLCAVSPTRPLVLINHFPLLQELAVLPRIPRFTPWCGTQRTNDWHQRFPVDTVIYGHLHIRGSYIRNSVRFEEVSLGYPHDWDVHRGIQGYLREITFDAHREY